MRLTNLEKLIKSDFVTILLVLIEKSVDFWPFHFCCPFKSKMPIHVKSTKKLFRESHLKFKFRFQISGFYLKLKFVSLQLKIICTTSIPLVKTKSVVASHAQ